MQVSSFPAPMPTAAAVAAAAVTAKITALDAVTPVSLIACVCLLSKTITV